MQEPKQLQQLQETCGPEQTDCLFGGAGVSTESGIPDFRSVDGLYNQRYTYPPEVMLSHHFYVAHTEGVFRFLPDKMLYLDAQPNAAHIKAGGIGDRQESLLRSSHKILTDCIRKPGVNVLELHGSVHRNFCQRCHKMYDAQFMLHSTGNPTLYMRREGDKPDVVLL